MRRYELTLPPGKMKPISTAAGDIQVIGGQDRFFVRRPKSQAHMPDTTYFGGQTLVIHREKSDLVIKAHRTTKEETAPYDETT